MRCPVEWSEIPPTGFFPLDEATITYVYLYRNQSDNALGRVVDGKENDKNELHD